MTDSLEVLDLSMVEAQALADATGSSLLDAIHQRWLERTHGGDHEMIALRLREEVSSAEPDEEACVELIEGFIAEIGKNRAPADMDEAEVYITGKRAVQAYLESTTSTQPESVNLWDALEVIEETYPQPAKTKRMEALELANQTRSSLAKIRAELRQGKISLSEVLSDPAAEGATIGDLLIRVPRIGKTRRRMILKSLGIKGTTEVRDLPEAQKSRLSTMFPPGRYKPNRSKHVADRTQSMAALKKGNEKRIYRADLKKKLAAGKISPEDVLEDPVGADMELGEMLVRLPTIRDAKPKDVRSFKLRDVILSETNLPDSKPLNQLTERQQRLLLSNLSRRYREESGIYSTAASHNLPTHALSW